MTSLHHHLRGVHDILESWGEAEDVCMAGLLNCAYSANESVKAIYALEDRDEVRSLVGGRAERLIYLFEAIGRHELREMAGQRSSLPLNAGYRSHVDGKDQTIEAHDLRDLVAILIADTAQQSSPNGFPIPWLCQSAALANSISAAPVPIFSRGTATVTQASEARLLTAYADAWREPLVETYRLRLLEAVEAIPFVAEPFVLLALVAIGRGDHLEAVRLAELAHSILLEWGTAWDKRLTEADWLSLILFLRQILSAPEPMSVFIRNLVAEMLGIDLPTPESCYIRLSAMELLPIPRNEDEVTALTADDDVFCDDDFETVPARFCDFLDGLLDEDPKRALAHYPGLRARPWWEPERFPIVEALEASAEEIGAEFATLDPRTFHEESERIGREGNWQVCILYERGRKREDRCAALPTTMRIIEEHSTLRTQAGLIYFSRLTPGSIVAPHHGPTNLRLRCHLGIRIPDGCGISVDNITRTWMEGKCIVFDDSFMHAVWNSSNEDRVVLIVDIWHPDLEPREIELLSGLHRYGESLAGGLNRYWRKNDEALLAAN